MRHAPLRQVSGFTLIELVISIVLLGLLAGVGVTMVSDSFDTTRYINGGQASAAEARYALERIERELREVQYVGSPPDGTFTITAPGTLPAPTTPVDTITFTNQAGATITIKRGTTRSTDLVLVKSPSTAENILASNVSGFSLAFYPVSGTATATKSTVRFIDIALTLTNPDISGGQQLAQRARVALRNG